MAVANSRSPAVRDAGAGRLARDEVAALLPPPLSPECWADADQTDLVCRKVLDITHDVKSFLFAAPEGRVFRFDPGQFVTLQLDIDGRRVSRCYTISSPPTRPPADEIHETAVYSVEFIRSGRTITCRADENVLDAAWTAGLTPASSCGQGMCGTCKTTMLSGDVDMQHNGGIRPREITQNKILICCSKPRSDLRIDC